MRRRLPPESRHRPSPTTTPKPSAQALRPSGRSRGRRPEEPEVTAADVMLRLSRAARVGHRILNPDNPRGGASGRARRKAEALIQAKLAVNARRRFEPPFEEAEPETQREPAPQAEVVVEGGGGASEGEGQSASDTAEATESDGAEETAAAQSAPPAAGGHQAEVSGAGERSGAGGGGSLNARCYREGYEVPDEEPARAPQEPPTTAAAANMESESPEVEERAECPVEQEVESQTASATPARDVARDAAGSQGAPAAAGGEPATPAGEAVSESAAPIEATIAQTEAQRRAAVAAYQTASGELETAGSNARTLDAVEFAPEDTADAAGRARQAEASGRADSFFSRTSARIGQAVAMAHDAVPDRIGNLAESVKASITAAIETQKAAIAQRGTAARSQATAAAEAARERVRAEHGAASATMEAETAAAVDTLSGEHQSALRQIDEREAAGLGEVNALYARSRTAHEQLGVTVGQEAVARGEEYYNAYEGCKINKSDGFWVGHLTDRRAAAQQNAAREVARGYRDSLGKAARDQARELMKGRKKDRCAVITAARRARDTVDDQFDAMGTSLETGLARARQGAERDRDQALTSIDGALAVTLHGLEQQKHSRLEAVNDTGYLQQVAVEQAAHSAAASIQASVTEAVNALDNALREVRGTFAATPAPEPGDLDQLLAQAGANLETGLSTLTSQVEAATARVAGRLSETGTRTHGALADIARNHDAQSAEAGEGFAGSMAALAEGVGTSFGQRGEQYARQVGTLSTAGAAGFQQVVRGFEQSVTAVTTNVASALGDSEKKLGKSLRDSLASIDSESTGIPKQAAKAASKEQPAWKTVVAVVLIIAVIVVVALVIGPAVIGAMGAAASALGAGAAAGAIGAIVGGAIVGAATSAAIQVLNNWRTGQDLTEGVGRSALMGALGGAFGAAAGLGIAALAAKHALGPIFQFAANIAADAVMELGTALVTGAFSWEALGMAMLMSFVTGGFGEVRAVKNLQARMQYRGARGVPGQRGRAYAETIRPPVEVEATPRPAAEAEAPRPTSAVEPETGTAPQAKSGESTSDIELRDTLGWSGEPTPTPAPGKEHLKVIHEGQEFLQRISSSQEPDLKTQLDESLARIENPIPEHRQQLDELGAEQARIYNEEGRIIGKRRDVVERDMGPGAAQRHDQLTQRLEEITTEMSRLGTEIEEARPRYENQAKDVMNTIRRRLINRRHGKGRKLAKDARIKDSAVEALVKKGRTKEQAISEIDEFYEIVGSKGPDPKKTRIISSGGRAEANPGVVDIGKSASKKTIFHEMMHHLELTDPNLAKASRAFVEARAARIGEAGNLYHLRDLVPEAGYEYHEVAMLGDFIDLYMGKVYPQGQNASEVICTGIERFVGPKSMRDFYRQDPEHFLYVLGAITSKKGSIR